MQELNSPSGIYGGGNGKFFNFPGSGSPKCGVYAGGGGGGASVPNIVVLVDHGGGGGGTVNGNAASWN